MPSSTYQQSQHPPNRPLRSTIEAFEISELSNRIQNCRLGIILAVFFIPLGSLTDIWVYPDQVGFFGLIRCLCAFAIGLVAFPLRRATTSTINFFSNLIMMIPTLLVFGIVYLGGDPATPYYSGLCLIMVAGALILRWRFIDALLYSVWMIVSYLNIYLHLGGGLGGLAVISYFLVATALFTTLAAYFYTNLRYREFYLREEVETNRRELIANYEELQAVDEAKNRFFANVSHELRTPLTLILGPIEQLTSYPALQQLPEAQSQIETLSENSVRLLRLINDLLEITRLETGDLPSRIENVHLPEFAEGIRRSLAAMAEAKNIRFEVRSFLPEHKIQALDRDRLEKILINLCINSLKFTPVGGTLYLKIRLIDRQLNIVVADTGIGISKEDLPHVFERFWQADSTTRRRSRGTGIGLALAKNLAESMGGSLMVTAVPEKGTTFTLSLPVNPAQIGLTSREPIREDDDIFDRISAQTLRLGITPTPAPLKPTFNALPPITNKRFSVLVVDDEESMRSYIASFMKEHRILEASDGQEALAIARKEKPDLLILDYMMPEIDGIEVSRQLREDPATSKIPIILITAHGGDAPRIAALEAGVNDFLTKPFYSSELLARTQNLLLNRKYQSDLQESNEDLSHALVQLKEQGEELVRSEKFSSLGQMSAGIVHEINNPLNYAKTSLHLLKSFRKDIPETELEDFDETLEDLSEAIQRVIHIITDLRSLSRGEDVLKTKIPLLGVINNALRFLSNDLQEITIDLQVSPEMIVLGNDNQLCQVFVNLIQNAIHAMTDVKDPQLTIRAKDESESMITLSLRDNGCGMSPAVQRKIFDPFYTTKDIGVGMGLGLSLNLKIIQDHRGEIQVESQLGSGTVFHIRLPSAD